MVKRKKSQKERAKDFILWAGLCLLVMGAVSAGLGSHDLDTLCNLDDNYLFRYAGSWICREAYWNNHTITTGGASTPDVPSVNVSADPLIWTKFNNTYEEGRCDTTCASGHLPIGSNGKGDDDSSYFGTILFNGSIYQGWYTGGDGSRVRIYYATSPDGITWTKFNNTAPADCDGACGTPGQIGFGSAGKGDVGGVQNPSVVLHNGVYTMMYSGKPPTGAEWTIFMANSSDGINWVKYNNTVPGECDTGACGTPGIVPDGSLGTGDTGQVFSADLMYDESDNLYKLWYSGFNNGYELYQAVSTDALNWNKTNNANPADNNDITTGGRLARGTGSVGDTNWVFSATVVKIDGSYNLWYGGRVTPENMPRIYYANGTNTSTWKKYNNSIPGTSNLNTSFGQLGLGSAGKGDDARTYLADAWYEAPNLRMWYTGYNGSHFVSYYAFSNGSYTAPIPGSEGNATNVDVGIITHNNVTINGSLDVLGGILLPYGEMYAHNDSTNGFVETISGANTPTNITFAMAGEYGNKTFRMNTTGNSFIIAENGDYKVDYSISFGGGINDEYKVEVSLNGVLQENTEIHRKLGASGDVGNAGGTGILKSLVKGDEINLQIENVDSANDAQVHAVNMNLYKIGGSQ